MRYAMKFSLVAGLAAGALAHQHHGHHHLHARKEASAVEDNTKYVPEKVSVVYVVDGEPLTEEEAKQGIKDGNLVVVGESEPTASPPPPPPKPTTTSSSTTSSSSTSEAELGAQFIEKTTSTTAAAPTSSPAKPSKSPSAPSGGSSVPSGGKGLTAKFPSGKVKCSNFPDEYGPIPIDYLGFNGWTGVQQVPDFSFDVLSISKIITAIAGEGCTEGSMCSYACPPGYQKTQWPKAQGSTLESVGGLYCNNDGYLELTREGSDTLCEPGAGGVSAKNTLDKVVSVCRTDYPGTENMVIPAVAEAGNSVELCNPEQDNYFVWDGKKTTAQYYISNAGWGAEDTCLWKSDKEPDSLGNWAPMNIGVGKSSDGTSYLSIFLNKPTSNAKLDFNVAIKGDVTTECKYENGKFSGSSQDGCTTGLQDGGKAYYEFY